MDPDKALKTIRHITAKIRLRSARMNDVDRLEEAVTALDEWISKGGFLPEAWRKSPEVK